jgi:trk system potassium uptake protein TrkA
MGVRLAHNLVTSNVMDFIELSPNYGVVEIVAPAKFTNKTLGELNLRAKYGINVMTIKRGADIIIAPGADTIIEENDVLIIVSRTEILEKLPK